MDYTIKRGDTLGELASRFNTSVKKLAEENQISNPDLIHEGATLRVPEAAPPAPRPQTQPLQADQARVSREAGGTMELHQGVDLEEVARRSQVQAGGGPPGIELHKGVDLQEVAQRAREAQALQPVQAGGGEDPELMDLIRPESPTPRVWAPGESLKDDPTFGKPAEAPAAEHKNWFDKLVEGGEDLVANTVGKIPLIGGLFTASAQVTGGALKAVGDMVGGIGHAVLHPVKTLKGLWGLAAHIPFSPPNLIHLASQAIKGKGPKEMLQEEGQYLKGLWNGLTAGYQQSIKDGRWGEIPGRLVVDVGSLLIGAGEANAAAKGVSAAGRAAEVVGATSKTVKAADAAGKVAKVAEVTSGATKAVKAVDAASDAARAAEAARLAAQVTETATMAAKVAEVAGQASKVSRAVTAFKASSVGKAVLDVGAGLSLMGESVAELGKAVWAGVKAGGTKVPAKQLAEAEQLASRAQVLAKEFEAASSLSGAAGFQRMQTLAKEATQIAEATDKLGKANSGLRGVANAAKGQFNHALEAFKGAGGAGHVLDLGAMALESARALGNVGLEAARLAGRTIKGVPGYVRVELRQMSTALTSMSARTKAATALKGDQAASKLAVLADETAQMARRAAELAKQTGDASIAQLAAKLGVEEANLRRATAVASLGTPLRTLEGGRAAVDGQ